MLNCFCRWVVPLMFLVATLPGQSLFAKSPASVITPKRNQEVAGLSEFIGKLNVAGYPIVLVKSAADHQWWVQPAPQVDERGFFRTFVTFGNDKTAQGTRFHVVVVVLADENQANLLVKMGTIEKIPLNIHRSAEQVFSYSSAAKFDIGQGTLTGLKKGAQVDRRTEIKGSWQEKGVPLLVVRTEEPQGPWWIQPHPDVSEDGKLTGTVHFGNDETSEGTKFRIAVYSLRSGSEQKKYTVGTICDTMPDDRLLMESFVVEATGGDKADASKKTPASDSSSR